MSSGLDIKIKSDFPNTYGFGSSSAVTVCITKALTQIFDIEVTNKSMFDIIGANLDTLRVLLDFIILRKLGKKIHKIVYRFVVIAIIFAFVMVNFNVFI